MRSVIVFLAALTFFSAGIMIVSGTFSQAVATNNNQRININTATVQELMQLPGIGEQRSHAIIQNRPFKSAEDLVKKNIMPPHLYDVLKDKIKTQ